MMRSSNLIDYVYVRNGSWVCENARALKRDRTSYSFEAVFSAHIASAFSLVVELGQKSGRELPPLAHRVRYWQSITG